MRHALFVWLLLCSTALSAAVYKWVDGDGNVHYSDIPQDPNAEQVDLPESSRYQPRLPEIPGAGRGPSSEPESSGGRSESGGRRVLEIVQPEKDATLRNNQGTVPVVLLVNPDLGDGQYLQLMLDGTPVEGRHTDTSMRLEGVDRGAHVLQARLIDKGGTTVASSESIRFYMRRASRFDPQRPSSPESSPSPLPPAPGTGSDPGAPGSQRPTGPAGGAYNPSFTPNFNQ